MMEPPKRVDGVAPAPVFALAVCPCGWVAYATHPLRALSCLTDHQTYTQHAGILRAAQWPVPVKPVP